jgi:hypothetical protein
MPIESLPVTLTSDEILVRAEQLSVKVKELEDEERDSKTAASLAKERIKEIDEEIRSLARTVREKREYRPVEVREMRNEERRTMDIVRIDTQEVVRYRSMTERELTTPLFPVEDEAEKAPASA